MLLYTLNTVTFIHSKIKKKCISLENEITNDNE